MWAFDGDGRFRRFELHHLRDDIALELPYKIDGAYVLPATTASFSQKGQFTATSESRPILSSKSLHLSGFRKRLLYLSLSSGGPCTSVVLHDCSDVAPTLFRVLDVGHEHRDVSSGCDRTSSQL